MTIIMNRNTSPVRPLTDEQLTQVVVNTPLNQYPEAEIVRFKELYAAYHKLNPAELELANGSDEWLQKFMIQFGHKGVLAVSPDFFMYQDYARQIERPFWQVDSDDNFSFQLEDILAGIESHQPSLLIISNPQNPTGTQFSAEFLQRLADAMDAINGIFVIDEAYIEFGDEYSRPHNENVIVVRTLSKIYGLAGLRIGIAIAKGSTYDKMVSINHPYPINNLALNIANTLFEDAVQLDKWIKYQKESQKALVKAFEIVSDVMTVKPTKSNFVFTYGENAMSLANYLNEKGYLARTYPAIPQLHQAARYSIIELEEYAALETALRTWREQIA